MRKFLLGLLVGVIIGVPGVALARHVHDQTIAEIHPGASGYVHRWDDPQFQVKCWESKDGYSGGLSCLPWDQVKER